MTDKFSITPLPRLLRMILEQYDHARCIFGIPEELFFRPIDHADLARNHLNQLLESPVGVAAGPHTQLAQNIVAAWLTGARFIELKTIQTLDELEVSKPCIDIPDEGYNCEWSQELKVRESFDQYLNACIIIHVLRHKFGWAKGEFPGVIFNMSVGYNYEGILKENVQWYLENMKDATGILASKTEQIRHIYPDIDEIRINPCISDNITLSTMHGCPPDEIEKIAAYLIRERKLHTVVKLNPTLIGREMMNDIMQKSGFETIVPDIAFEHDLKYDDGIAMIARLKALAEKEELYFGVKLTNTLESVNHRDVFSENEKMMYMSGRSLHPVSVNLANKLQTAFDGKLNISFSGGADAFNVADVLKCGLFPVTVCTDLLKPGGYGRMSQYFTGLTKGIYNGNHFEYLRQYAKQTLKDPKYRKSTIRELSIKSSRALGAFDCISAPCVETCATNQGIPDYLHHTSKGSFRQAMQVIRETNPFPHTTGMICDHLCQTKCTRINYDSPVLIREIKRFNAENVPDTDKTTHFTGKTVKKAAVIGAGPSGLSCAYYLAMNGIKVDVYESKPVPGGMVSGAIPAFRLTEEAFDLDIQKIIEAGVEIHYEQPVEKPFFEQLQKENDFIYIGSGAQKSSPLNIPGIEAEGVLDPLEFLFRVKKGQETGIGEQVIIIGGGNTAMDAARTAIRLVGSGGKVTIVYRRTIRQMPADMGEIRAVLNEGVEVIELAAPLEVVVKDGKACALRCIRMETGEKDASGRLSVKEIPGSEFDVPADTIIPAIGQMLNIDFLDLEMLKTYKGSYATRIPGVYIGGDAMRGAATAIKAIGDGRKAAEEILQNAGIIQQKDDSACRQAHDHRELIIKRTQRVCGPEPVEIPFEDRKHFNLVSKTMDEKEAVEEAARCLWCDELCSICTTVCPNLALQTYFAEPASYPSGKIISDGENHRLENPGSFDIRQKYQILQIADWCNACGNCVTFCPTSGAPFREKPHVYLDKTAFETEKDGFFAERKLDGMCINAYHEGQCYQLAKTAEWLVFSSDQFRIKMDASGMEIRDIESRSGLAFEADLEVGVRMKLILEGLEKMGLC